jgi:hypothetical protein
MAKRGAETDQVFILLINSEQNEQEDSQRDMRAGALCPSCHKAEMDYDGLLNLVCVNCGYTLAGCFT